MGRQEGTGISGKRFVTNRSIASLEGFIRCYPLTAINEKLNLNKELQD